MRQVSLARGTARFDLASCALAIGLWAAPCRAEVCRVELLGTHTEAWREALASLPSPGPSADDCASLRIETDDQGGRMLFVTHDGRRAERHLSSPDELVPTFEALRVAGPRRSEAMPTGSAVTPGPSAPAADSGPSQAPPPEPKLAALFSLHTGVRVGEDAALSPVLGSALSMRIRHWELGVGFAWEARYYDLRGLTGPLGRTLLVPSLGFARRQPLGRIALLAGLRLAMPLLLPVPDQNIAVPAEIVVSQAVREEGRLGVVLGLVLWREAPVRFRAELSADFVFWRSLVRNSFTLPPDTELIPDVVPGGSTFANNTPGWAITCSAGLEFGGP